MSRLRHNVVQECPVCSSHHVTDHCKTCEWWVCRKCGSFGIPYGNRYTPRGKKAA